MQNVTYSEKLKTAPSLHRLAERATAYLDGVVSPWLRPVVSADWDRIDDPQGGPAVTLTLREEGDTVTTRFNARELENDREVNSRIRDLWGDLLRIHSHTLLDNLLQSRGGTQE